MVLRTGNVRVRRAAPPRLVFAPASSPRATSRSRHAPVWQARDEAAGAPSAKQRDVHAASGTPPAKSATRGAGRRDVRRQVAGGPTFDERRARGGHARSSRARMPRSASSFRPPQRALSVAVAAGASVSASPPTDDKPRVHASGLPPAPPPSTPPRRPRAAKDLSWLAKLEHARSARCAGTRASCGTSSSSRTIRAAARRSRSGFGARAATATRSARRCARRASRGSRRGSR